MEKEALHLEKENAYLNEFFELFKKVTEYRSHHLMGTVFYFPSLCFFTK